MFRVCVTIMNGVIQNCSGYFSRVKRDTFKGECTSKCVTYRRSSDMQDSDTAAITCEYSITTMEATVIFTIIRESMR